MQLVAQVSIPKSASELALSELTISTSRLKKLRRKGLPIEWFVLFALELSYDQKNPSVYTEKFCEDWGLTDYELDSAIAKLQKKGLLHRPTATIQLELFADVEGENGNG